MRKALKLRNFYNFFRASRKEKEVMGWASKNISRKKIKIGNYEFTYEKNGKKGLMGRFGGGWQYKLGIDIGGSTVILNLLIATLRIYHKKEVKKH